MPEGLTAEKDEAISDTLTETYGTCTYTFIRSLVSLFPNLSNLTYFMDLRVIIPGYHIVTHTHTV